MEHLKQIIDRSIASGSMTQAQHDKIMAEIQRDGRIDSRESALLSQLFAAVQQGKLKIVDSDREKIKEREVRLSSEEESAKNEVRLRQRQSAMPVADAVEQAIKRGTISQSEHDRIMRQIHADGKIDSAERELMSRLFSAIQTGALKISDAYRETRDTTAERVLEERKQQAVENDTLREAPRPPEPEELQPETEAQIEPEPLPQTPPPINAAAADYQSRVDASYEAFLSSFGRPCLPRETGKAFELHNDRLLDVRLNGRVWIKTGAMVGYYGTMKFTREGIFEHGISRLIKKAATGEGATLSKAAGSGNLYLADAGKKISVVDLRGQALVVGGQSILAFEESIAWDIQFLKQIAAAVVGGLFNVRLNGSGMVAITSHFDPVVLRVSPGQPVNTDYHATVAWSGGLSPTIRTDVSSQTLIGRASGETLQMQFQGDGFVIIQPFEENPAAASE